MPRTTKSTPPWKKPNPRRGESRKKLSPAQKATAKTRAKRAGRTYPNLVDNMWAAAGAKSKGKSRGNSRKKSAKGRALNIEHPTSNIEW